MAAASQVGRAAEKGSAYSLIGDRFHNSDYIRVGLTRTIQKDEHIMRACYPNLSQVLDLGGPRSR